MDTPERLLAEAAARLQTEADHEVLCEAQSLLEAEHARTALSDRLRGSAQISVGLASGAIRGRVDDAGSTWLIICDERLRHLVPIGAITWIEGLGDGLSAESVKRPGRSIGSCVRELTDAPIELVCATRRLASARIVSVGSDHLDVIACDAEPSVRVTMPFAFIERISRPLQMDATPRTLASGRTSW